MNSINSLTKTIDTLQAEGLTVKITRLPSQAKRNRKTLWTPKTRGTGSTKVS